MIEIHIYIYIYNQEWQSHEILRDSGVTRTEWRVYRECKWQMGERVDRFTDTETLYDVPDGMF